MLDEQSVHLLESGHLRHHSGLPEPGGALQYLHVGPGGLPAVEDARRGCKRWRTEGQKGEDQQVVEGLRDRAGPQLCAGFTFWLVECHLRLCAGHLHLHRPQLTARSVKIKTAIRCFNAGRLKLFGPGTLCRGETLTFFQHLLGGGSRNDTINYDFGEEKKF